MLDKTSLTRHRTRVEAIDAQGRVIFSIYPSLNQRLKFAADSAMINDDLDFSTLRMGQPFDVIMAYGEAIAIEKPQIHAFDLKTLYPKGLDCLTATVNQAAEGVYGAVRAKKTLAGHEETDFRITPLTRLFQAQQNQELATRIYRGLKSGDSVNIWVAPDATGPVVDALYLSVNFR